MAGNNDPIYSRVGDIQNGQIASSGTVLGFTANTVQDGSGTLYPIWQAGSDNGGYLQKLAFQSVGSPAATVCRVFLSSITGAWTGNTATNTWLYTEVGLPTITLSQTAASPHIESVLNIAVPVGYRIVIAFGTSTGGSAAIGWSVTGVGGSY